MGTISRTLNLDPDAPDQTLIDQSAEVLKAGGLLVGPTETRYGLLGRADSQEVLERLYALKRRPLNLATALLVKSREEIENLAVLDSTSNRLLEKFLPGPLTLVLKARKDWPPPRVVDGKIGIRWSPAKFIGALLPRIDFPVTATSANISGQPEPSNVEEIKKTLGDAVTLYIDSGELTGPPSTVIECVDEGAEILREGALSRSELLACLGDRLE